MRFNNYGRRGSTLPAPGCLTGVVALVASLTLGLFGLMVMFSGCAGH